MNLRPLTTRRFTFEDFCILVRDGQKADLIDGVIHMASPENWEALTLFALIFRLMGDFVETHNLGIVVGPRTAFRLDDRGSPEPDVAFVRKDREHLARESYFAGPPDLAVEIVSPESAERDYVAKRHQYREAGVPEYWIIDEENRRLTLLHLDARGRYREFRPRRGKYLSRALPRFFLRAEWLWQDPLPAKTVLLKQILEEPGAENGA